MSRRLGSTLRAKHWTMCCQFDKSTQIESVRYLNLGAAQPWSFNRHGMRGKAGFLFALLVIGIGQ
jgi:hypothetical protein